MVVNLKQNFEVRSAIWPFSQRSSHRRAPERLISMGGTGSTLSNKENFEKYMKGFSEKYPRTNDQFGEHSMCVEFQSQTHQSKGKASKKVILKRISLNNKQEVKKFEEELSTKRNLELKNLCSIESFSGNSSFSICGPLITVDLAVEFSSKTFVKEIKERRKLYPSSNRQRVFLHFRFPF